MPDSVLLRVQPDDLAYLDLARAEAGYWSVQHPAGLEVWENLRDGPIDMHTNERFTGSRHTHWYETIARYGEFTRGLFLGTSGLRAEAAILRTNPRLRATFVDLSDGALQRRIERLSPEFGDRIDVLVADINFIDLPAATYDLIVSSSTIHHVTNLEYLAGQVNRALTGTGCFFLHDYVGEPRFGASPEKRRVFELLSDRDCRRRGLQPQAVHWLDASDLSPLCGVRSDEIPAVFEQHLRAERIRTAGALTVPLLRTLRAGPASTPPPTHRLSVLARKLEAKVRRRPYFQRNWIDRRYSNELALVGDVLADAGMILPGNIFGIYRRR